MKYKDFDDFLEKTGNTLKEFDDKYRKEIYKDSYNLLEFIKENNLHNNYNLFLNKNVKHAYEKFNRMYLKPKYSAHLEFKVKDEN